MMRTASALLLAVLSAGAGAQTTCTTIGNFTTCSDGSSSQRIGNMTFGNDGSSTQRIGNTTIISPGYTPPPAYVPPPTYYQPPAYVPPPVYRQPVCGYTYTGQYVCR